MIALVTSPAPRMKFRVPRRPTLAAELQARNIEPIPTKDVKRYQMAQILQLSEADRFACYWARDPLYRIKPFDPTDEVERCLNLVSTVPNATVYFEHLLTDPILVAVRKPAWWQFFRKTEEVYFRPWNAPGLAA